MFKAIVPEKILSFAIKRFESQKYNQETEFSFAIDKVFQEQWFIKNIFKYFKQMREREHSCKTPLKSKCVYIVK
jgi:hypothetical protein